MTKSGKHNRNVKCIHLSKQNNYIIQKIIIITQLFNSKKNANLHYPNDDKNPNELSQYIAMQIPTKQMGDRVTKQWGKKRTEYETKAQNQASIFCCKFKKK